MYFKTFLVVTLVTVATSENIFQKRQLPQLPSLPTAGLLSRQPPTFPPGPPTTFPGRPSALANGPPPGLPNGRPFDHPSKRAASLSPRQVSFQPAGVPYGPPSGSPPYGPPAGSLPYGPFAGSPPYDPPIGSGFPFKRAASLFRRQQVSPPASPPFVPPGPPPSAPPHHPVQPGHPSRRASFLTSSLDSGSNWAERFVPVVEEEMVAEEKPEPRQFGNFDDDEDDDDDEDRRSENQELVSRQVPDVGSLTGAFPGLGLRRQNFLSSLSELSQKDEEDESLEKNVELRALLESLEEQLMKRE